MPSFLPTCLSTFLDACKRHLGDSFGLGADAPKDAPEGCALYGFITGFDVSGQPQHVGP